MRSFINLVAGALAGIAAIGFMTATAHAKPAYCAIDHDHRSHAADYYDYYTPDRYSRAGPYSKSGVSLSLSLGDGRYDGYGYGRRYDDRRYDHDRRYRGGRYDHDRRYRGRRSSSQVVKRRVYDTRYRAEILLVEEIHYGHRGRRDLVCTLDVRGPDARYVSRGRVRSIAARECSRRAHVRFV